MASAEQSSIENLQTLLSEEVLHTVQNYFEIKIVHENGGSLFFFLHNRVHELFHYFVKQTPCCNKQTPCALIENKGTLTKDQFDLLYYYDPSVQPVHEKKDKERILLHCICAISPNQEIDVSDLDFTLINCLVKTCHKTPAGNPKWLKDILEVRNRLSHLGDASCIAEHQIQNWWTKLENASISIAGTIGIVYQKGVRKRISKLKKSQSHLDELMKALKTRDDEMEKKILSALENMGVKTAGVCFRVTTVEFTREQPKTTLTAPVVTPCNDPKKCTVVWKFSDAGEWDVKEMQKKLECISIIGDFNIEFVYQGCLIVYTTAERYILADVDAFKDATEEFLWLFRKRLGKLIVESDCSISVAISIWDHNKHGSPFDQKEEAARFTNAQVQITPSQMPKEAILNKQIKISGSLTCCAAVDDTYVISDLNNNRLVLYDKNDDNLRNIFVSGKPWTVTAIDDTKVAVGKWNKDVEIIDVAKCDSIRKFRVDEFVLGGLSYYEHHFYVGVANNIIHVIDLSGHLIRRISTECNAEYITVDRNCIYISDGKEIVCSNMRGETLWKYENPTIGYINGLSTDEDGNIFFTDNGNHQVMVITRYGKLSGDLLSESDGLKHPTGIWYNRKTKTLLVCNYRGPALLFNIIK